MAWYPPGPTMHLAQHRSADHEPRPRFVAPLDASSPPTSTTRHDSRFAGAHRHRDSSYHERARSPDRHRFDRRRLQHHGGSRPWWEDERDEAARVGRRPAQRERDYDEPSRSSFRRRGGHEPGEGGGGTRRGAPRSTTRLPNHFPASTDRLPARPPTALRVHPATKVTDPLVHLSTSLASTRGASNPTRPHKRSRSTEAVPLRVRVYYDLDAPPREQPMFVPSRAPREASSSHARTVRAPLGHMGNAQEPSSSRASRRTPYVASLPTWQSSSRRPPRTEKRAPAGIVSRLERSSLRSRPRYGRVRGGRDPASGERSPSSSRSSRQPLGPLSSSLARNLPSPPPRPLYPPRLHPSPPSSPSPALPPSPPPLPPRLPSRLSSPSDPSPPWLADALYGPSFVQVEQWYRDAEVRAREGDVQEVAGGKEARGAKRASKLWEEDEAGGGGKRRRGGRKPEVVEDEVVWLNSMGWEAEWKGERRVRGEQAQHEVPSGR